jgi:hypothetical protein
MKPSVTKLISLLDKPALLTWANKIGLQGIKLEDYKKKSLSFGSNIHKQIENYIIYNIPFENIETQKKFDDFFKDKKIIDIEKNIETDNYIGRLDIKYLQNNEIYICDFKSNQKYIYLENKLQLCAYKQADNCDRLGVISVPDFNFIECKIDDYNIFYKIISDLCSLYKNIELVK